MSDVALSTVSRDECVACKTNARRVQPGTAFLAGIAFAFQFNNEAIRRQLCDDHAEAMVRGAEAAKVKVRPEDARVRKDGNG